MVNTKKICAHHIDEECIKEKILSKGKKGKCSYCKRKTRKVVDLKYVIDLIEIGINYFFEHPAESRNLNPNTESGFDGQTYYFQDIWNEFICLLGINEDALSEDIFTILNNPSFYVFKHEFGSIADYYLDSWDSFKRFVTHETRFVFDIEMNRYYYSHYYYMNPKSLLEELQNFIMDLNLFTYLSTDTKLYRCRQYQCRENVRSANDMASPPFEKALTHNRMSPAGISMFYCSNNREVSKKEVVNMDDTTKPYYSITFFKPTQKIKVLDLSQVPKTPSFFDKQKNHKIYTYQFLNGFIKDISKKICTPNYHIDYVPTQVITEYFKFNPKFGIDGIIYPSSKSELGQNIVLFYNHEQSLEKLEFQKSRIRLVMIDFSKKKDRCDLC